MKNTLFLFILFAFINCQKKQEIDPIVITPPPPPPTNLPVKVWTTSGNQYALLTPQTIDFAAKKDETLNTITIETNQEFQKIDGFGYTLTGGSAQLLMAMGATERKALLEELFGKNTNSIGVSYLRISIGASDLDANVFSYNDLPSGETDVNLNKFSMAKDSVNLLPVLKEILAIAPNVKIMGSPWSAPVWMKTNQNSVGGSLKPQYYATYAQYFVKYLQVMKSNGIVLDAVTLQNEPENGDNNPSLVMTAAEQTDFIKNHIGSAFQAAGITTKIILYDHNCDHPNYPIAFLNDPAAKAFVAGSAFHLYAGDISALSQVHQAHPDKDVYFTEQYVSKNGQFGGDLNWHIKNVMIGSLRNWSRVALEWNLANDSNFGPHTLGGCDQCLGAVTINGSTVTKNVSFYIVGQLAKFIPVGSTRLGSNLVSQLPNVAFKTPEGKTVLLVLNENSAATSFNINADDKWIKASLQPNTVGTFVL
jgi:glucosylceramidase